MQGLIGKKVGMTQIFSADGDLVPVTVLQTGPCTVVQKKTGSCDGYDAIQLGFGKQKSQRVSKAVLGHSAKSGGGPFAVLREFRMSDVCDYELGNEIKVDQVFASGERVHVVGRTKGRGYAGVMKRHGMGGFPKSHGTHEYFRHGGAIGNRSYPGKIFKGKRMAGHYGTDRMKALNLEVVDVRPADNLLFVKGSVPGSNGQVVLVQKAGEAE